MSDFVTVATTDEINVGERMVIEFGRDWVAIFNVDGQYYAIKDVCTHDNGPLAEGELTGCIIECPRHGATFDIRTGKALTAPAYIDVPVFEVHINEKDIQIRKKQK